VVSVSVCDIFSSNCLFISHAEYLQCTCVYKVYVSVLVMASVGLSKAWLDGIIYFNQRSGMLHSIELFMGLIKELLMKNQQYKELGVTSRTMESSILFYIIRSINFHQSNLSHP